MQITSSFSWPVVNWPTASAAASQYALFQVYPVSPSSSTPIQTVTTTTATLTFEETASLVYQVRPTDGTLYGSEVASFVVGDVPCRAWLRQKIRVALADRSNQAGVTLNWTDEEINTYIAEAINELSLLFPRQADTTIQLQGPVNPQDQTQADRSYPLPTDCYRVQQVEYRTQDANFSLFLKEKPFRGGETTAQTYIGYPKLGIMLSPQAGRFYPGHYDTYEQKIHLDWDPAGDGDYLRIRYSARYPAPTDDVTLLSMLPEDMELLSLRAQMKCWLRVEGSDTRLSRWRSKDDGSRRDDLPTVKMSYMIKQLYDQIVNDRREMRVRTKRLVRR